MTGTRRGWLRRQQGGGSGISGLAAAPAPRARRIPRAGFADLRLLLGLVLLVASVATGALVLSSAHDTVTVWRATRDLSVGSSPSDLVPVEVSRAVAETVYAAPGDRLDGVLSRPVAAGELVPRSSLASPPASPRRRVTVPVDPMHAPIGLQTGDVVDVWSTARDATGLTAQGAPRLVLTDIGVAASRMEDLGLGGEVSVVLDVPADQVADLVAAVRAGVTDLVAVPISSQRAPS